ncbi:MAG TPA: hypothetical protein VJU14_11110 [Solirubrobacterales bacterium]|nr:hypothetical protein [Solirubrobacterales bacterium]
MAAVTAFVPSREVPDDPFEGWFEERIGMAIDVLNEFLVALGVCLGDPRVGPVSRSELPAAVPLIAEEQPSSGEEREGSTWIVPIHPWIPNPSDETDPQAVFDAATLFRGAVEGTTPWFPVLEQGHIGLRDGLAGRYGASIVSAATSIEILLSTVVRSVGPVRGWSEDRIAGALGSGLKNLLTVHVPKLLPVSIDISDEATVWGNWWKVGYQVRNQVVHEGRRPSEEEADEAVIAAMDVVAAVGTVVKEDEDLQHLSFGIPNKVSAGDDWISRTSAQR